MIGLLTQNFSHRIELIWFVDAPDILNPGTMDPLRRLTAGQRYAFARQLRRQSTPAERHAWTLLRNRGVLGLKFRRQHVLHGFIVDFCCLAKHIVIELDGNVLNS